MNFLKIIWQSAVEALFPLSEAEKKLLAMTPEEALAVLPPAPAFDASVVPLENTGSVFAYKDERVSRLVWGIKYKKSAHLAGLAGFALCRNLPTGCKIALIPIPITRRRRLERGYNQCELLIAAMKVLDADERLICMPDMLHRTRNREEQKIKGRSERLVGAQNIFSVNSVAAEMLRKIPDVFVVVIDDVITTGSTMKAAQDVLKAAGFERVGGLSVAH